MGEERRPNVYIVAGPTKPADEIQLPPLFVKAEKAMKEAVASAIAEHWRAGRPVHIWRDGRVVELYPDSTTVPAQRDSRESDQEPTE